MNSMKNGPLTTVEADTRLGVPLETRVIGNKDNILKFFGQASHYLIGGILGMLSGFITMPILTRVLSKSDYGYLSLASTTLFLAVSLAKFGLQHSGVRFYPEFKYEKREEKITVYYTTLFWISLIFAFAIAFVFGVLIYISLRLSYPKIYLLVIVLAGLIVSDSLIVRFKNFLRAEQKTKLFNAISIIGSYFAILLGVTLLLMVSRTIEAYLFGNLIINFVLVWLFLIFFIKQGKIKTNSFSLSFMKECLRYGFPLLGFEVANFLIKFSDRYLIQIYLGAETVGIYSVGYNLAQYVSDAICLPLFYAIIPIYMDIYQEKGEEITIDFIGRTSSYIFILAIPILFEFCALAKLIAVTFASLKYAEASVVIPYVIFGTFLWGLYPIYAAGLYIKKKTKVLGTIVLIAAGLNIILNIILIPNYRLIGAALATFIAYIFMAIMVGGIAYKYLKFNFDFLLLAKSTFASTLMVIMLRILNFGTNIEFLFLQVLTGLITYCLIIFFLEKRIRQKVYNLLRFKNL
jgi:O-antigen/teichoic acid export membrane protein